VELAADGFADPGAPKGNAPGIWFLAPGAGFVTERQADQTVDVPVDSSILAPYERPLDSPPALDPYGATGGPSSLSYSWLDSGEGCGPSSRSDPRWFKFSRVATPGSKVRLMALTGLLGVTLLMFDARMGGDIGDTVVVPTAMSSASFRAAIASSTPRVQCAAGSDVSTGTGFAFEPSPGVLVVVTAAHVVAGCERGSVGLLFGRTRIEGVVLASDTTHDVAVIKTSYSLPPLMMGNVPESGDPIVVVGYPEGKPVAAVLIGRVNEVSDDELLMRVVVSPGVSGSPVIDEQRHVVGIVTADVQASIVETGVATRLDVVCRELVRCSQLTEE